MIKIKDYIFNENEIHHINENKNILIIFFKNPASHTITLDATFDDIEWNYGEKENTDLITIKDYVRDNWGELFNKDTTLKQMLERIILRYNLAEEDLKNESNNYKECIEEKYKLEEENKKLKENRDKVLKYLKNEYNLLIEKGYMTRYTHGKLEGDIDFLCNEIVKEHIDIREMLEGEEND